MGLKKALAAERDGNRELRAEIAEHGQLRRAVAQLKLRLASQEEVIGWLRSAPARGALFALAQIRGALDEHSAHLALRGREARPRRRVRESGR